MELLHDEVKLAVPLGVLRAFLAIIAEKALTHEQQDAYDEAVGWLRHHPPFPSQLLLD